MGVADTDVEIVSHKDSWDRNQGGFQIALVQYPAAAAAAADDLKLNPQSLMDVLRGRPGDLVVAADGFDAYGDMTIHAMGQRRGVEGGVTVEQDGSQNAEDTLGMAFRRCEGTQRAKYGRLKTKAFARLHKHVAGAFEPFTRDDRKAGRCRLTLPNPRCKRLELTA